MRACVVLIVSASLVSSASVALASWQPDGIAVSASANYQTTQAVVPDGAGGVIVTWHDYRSGTSYDIYAQRVDASGNPLWATDGVAISIATGDQAIPAIASDGAGGAIIAWYDDRTMSFSSDIYAQRISASGTVMWTANGVAISTALKSQTVPQIVSDGSGGAIVVWEDGRVSGLDRDIYAQRINATGTVQWTANGVALCNAASNQYQPRVVEDGAGGAIVTWQDYRVPGTSDIFAQRVNGSGAAMWAANGVAVTPSTAVQYSPMLVADGAGGAIISWQDFRSGLADIYAQRINALGTTKWTPDGVLLSAAGWEGNGAIIPDGTGGAIVSWHRIEADEFEYDLYAQRVNGSGAAQWGTDGVAISIAPGNQTASALVSDGNGGAFVTWEDSVYASNTNYDIRAQRLDATGALQWTPDGIAVCTASNEQRRPAILSDGSGGAIVAWEDFRSGTSMDIFALQIDGDQSQPTGAGNTPRASSLALSSNYPNPFSGQTTMELALPVGANVAVDVFDVGGRRVRHLDLGRMGAGARAISFDGLGDSGRPLPGGVYFYRVNANGVSATRKMIIAR